MMADVQVFSVNAQTEHHSCKYSTKSFITREKDHVLTWDYQKSTNKTQFIEVSAKSFRLFNGLIFHKICIVSLIEFSWCHFFSIKICSLFHYIFSHFPTELLFLRLSSEDTEYHLHPLVSLVNETPCTLSNRRDNQLTIGDGESHKIRPRFFDKLNKFLQLHHENQYGLKEWSEKIYG